MNRIIEERFLALRSTLLSWPKSHRAKYNAPAEKNLNEYTTYREVHLIELRQRNNWICS
jgi:hypothetical protein